MYIDESKGIQIMGYYVPTGGLDFATFDELADALRCLGKMELQDGAEVDKLIERLRRDIMSREISPTGVSRVMGNAIGDLSPGTVTLGPGDWEYGQRFATHNEGIYDSRPLGKHTLRIAELGSKQGDTGYRLKILDRTNPCDIDPVRIPERHSENLLAARLGRPRPLRSMKVCAYYVQDGAQLVFDFAPLLEALGSIDGLDQITDSPEAVANRYVEYAYRDIALTTKHPLVLRHSTGNELHLTGCYPLELYSGAFKLRRLVRREGSCVVGPLADTDLARLYGPHLTFGLYAPEFAQALTDPSDVLAANQRLIGLAGQLSDALWAHQLV